MFPSKYINLLFVLMLILFTSCGQHKSGEATVITDHDSMVSALINDLGELVGEDIVCKNIVADDSLFTIDSYYWDSIDISNNDTLFNEHELKFLMDRCVERRPFTKMQLEQLHYNIIPFDTLKSLFPTEHNPQEFWIRFNNKYGETGFCKLGMPIFTEDYQKAVLYLKSNSAPLGGYSGTYFFRIIGDKWTITKFVLGSIS